MASNVDTLQNFERKLLTDMKEFPHFTHLDAPGLTQERLGGLLENLEEESDSDDICLDETICKLNFKTWVYVRMGNLRSAEEVNKKVISKTNWENIMSVANRVFICWRAGREMEARECLSKLKDMKTFRDFGKRVATANAELGYSYSRIGGPINLFKAIELLEEFVLNYPQMLYWKLRLGLVYRRCTHFNIYSGMPKGHSYSECVQKSVTYLTDVAEHSRDNKLRGPAYSELAVLCKAVWRELSKQDRARMFNNKTAEDLCKLALQFGGDSTWVMTSCGKVWNSESVNILERCLRVKEHTTTHHQLGLCYAWRAEREAKADQQLGTRQASGQQNVRGQRGSCQRGRGATQRDSQRSRDRSYPKEGASTWKFPNEYFNKAEQEYLEAIRMSHNRNVPAIYSLGLLYKMAGQDDKALERFNQITNSGIIEHLITIIKAYEQAGLCYLKMGEGKFAEDKLTKAISLAVSVASSCPEIHDRATEVWCSFRTKIMSEEPSLSRVKKLIHLLELVRNYKNIVKVVETILDVSDAELNDPEFIISALNSYLKLKEPEKALIFLNMLSTRPDISSSESWTNKSFIDLKYKICLLAAKNRLLTQVGEARYIFQELFKLYYGQCAGNVSEDTVNASNMRDVLLFYDDAEESCQTSRIVTTLQDVFSKVFGLDTYNNLEGCLEYGLRLSIQLEEMKRYQVVIVVLGEEKRDREFQALLEMIPTMRKTDPQTTEVMVIDTCHERADIPGVLKQFHCFRIQEIMGNFGESLPAACSDGAHISVNDIVKNVVRDDLDALMRLFCFLIGQDWPKACK